MRTPAEGSAEADAPHTIVVDDVLLSRQEDWEEEDEDEDYDPLDRLDEAVQPAEQGSKARVDDLRRLLARYDEVGCRFHPEKVHDYAPVQELLGYTLDHNVLRSSLKRYRDLAARVAGLRRRGWARPREVEQLIGKFTNAFLLERSALPRVKRASRARSVEV